MKGTKATGELGAQTGVYPGNLSTVETSALPNK